MFYEQRYHLVGKLANYACWSYDINKIVACVMTDTCLSWELEKCTFFLWTLNMFYSSSEK